MNAKQALQLFLVVLLFGATCLIMVLMPPFKGDRASADIGDSDRLRLARDSERWITRKLIDGISIEVCTNDYPRATATAIARWNAALRISAFTLLQNVEDCDDIAVPSSGWHPQQHGVVRVTVSKGEGPHTWTSETSDKYAGLRYYQGSFVDVSGRGHRMQCHYGEGTFPNLKGANLGCAWFDHTGRHAKDKLYNEQWQTFYGRAEVVMHPEYYPRDYDPKHPTNIMRDIAHELGHILGLRDYFCDVVGPDYLAPDGRDKNRSLMNSWTNRPKCNAQGDVPTQRDKEDYRTVYLPATVTDVRGTANGRTVTLTWDQSDVFVESHFEIQRASGPSGTDWTTVERSVPANATRFTLTDQPSGVQRYRVVAATLALCPKTAPEHCIDDAERDPAYGSPSDAASVAIQLPAPTGLRVANRMSDSLSLTWDTVNGADRYELRRTTPSADCEGAVQATVTKPPHLFRNLTADTDYRLCVRAKLSTNSAVTSAWADEEAATLPVPNLTVSVSPRSASCYTGGSVSIRWTISNGTAPYAVNVNGVSANGSRTTVTCQSTAGAQTVSVTATDASTPQRSGSASVRLTVRNRPAPPPPEPTLTISASASPTSCTAGGTVNVRWSVSGASGSYTVTVGGRSVSTSPTSVTCRSTAGRQSITVQVRDSRGHSASRTLYVIVTAPPELLPPIDCLSSTTPGLATYTSGCGSVQVSSLLAAVRQVNSTVCAIRLWQIGEDGVGMWVLYGRSDGRLVPGSVNFQINAGDYLWLSVCTTVSGGASGASGVESPSCPDAVKPETGPAVIDADASSCTTVRGGGAVQISRGEYTLNVSLASGRDWFASAPASYTGSSAGAFLFLDLTTGGWIALYPPDGVELERHAPADAAALPALLDAIAASAAPSVYPAPDP